MKTLEIPGNNVDIKGRAEETAEDSIEIKERLASLPEELKNFFGKLNPSERRIFVSDESLLESSNDLLVEVFGMMREEFVNSRHGNIFERFMRMKKK